MVTDDIMDDEWPERLRLTYWPGYVTYSTAHTACSRVAVVCLSRGFSSTRQRWDRRRSPPNFHTYTDFRHFFTPVPRWRAGATCTEVDQVRETQRRLFGGIIPSLLLSTPSVLLRVSVTVGGGAFRSCPVALVGSNGARDRDLRMPLRRLGPRAYGNCLLLVVALAVESTPRPGRRPGIAVYGRRVVGFLCAQELVAGGTSVFALSHQIQSPSAVPAADDGQARKAKMAVGRRISDGVRVSDRDFFSCLRIGMAAPISGAHLQSIVESSCGSDA